MGRRSEEGMMERQKSDFRARNRIIFIGLLVTGLLGTLTAKAQSGADTLRVGISIAELPTLTGQPTQGGTGFRWTGWTVFDSLVYWDINQDKKIPTEIPYLAEEYSVRPEDK